MDNWLKISIFVCIFGFLKEFRPSDPYLYEYLIGAFDASAEDIIQKAYPLSGYSYVSLLIFSFLITDLSRYKPLIILLGLSGVVTWTLMLWTKTLLDLQILEVIYGIYLAAEVAYFTYIYAKVPRENYQQVTGHVRAAILGGRCLSAISSQLLVSFELMDLRDLNIITLTCQILATLWAISLPSVGKSIYFNQDNVNIKTAFKLLWHHFKVAYSKPHVVKWSVWWAMTTCITVQIENYTQPLWFVIQNNETAGYNGAITAASYLLGTVAALVAGNIKINWDLYRDIILIICSVILGAALLLSSQTYNIFASYAYFTVFIVLYHFTVTIASSEVAKNILDDSFGLVFGINTLLALILQSILTMIVVDGNIGFGLNPRQQFVVYGAYCLVIAAFYIFLSILSRIKQRKH